MRLLRSMSREERRRGWSSFSSHFGHPGRGVREGNKGMWHFLLSHILEWCCQDFGSRLSILDRPQRENMQRS
jgi:hypothetical protein